MSVFQDDGKRRAISIAVVMVIVGILIYSYWTSGSQGIKALFFKFVTAVLIFGIIFGLVYVVWRLFQKSPIDLIASDRQDIIDAATMGKNPLLGNLYLSGDKHHSEVKIGKIVGYCQIQNYKGMMKQIKERADRLADKGVEGDEDLSSDDGKVSIHAEDVFVFKTGNWITRRFERPSVLRVLPEEHSELIGDVKVYAVSLIKKHGYYYPNIAHLDVERIDFSVAQEAMRGMIKVVMDDVVDVTKKAMGADQQHEKALQFRKLLKIPRSMGDEEERMG